MKRKLVLSLVFLAAISTAVAQDAERKGFYVGASLGSAGLNVEGEDLISDVDEQFDDEDTGWKALGGYRFIPWFGVEASYIDFGNPSGSFGSEDVEFDIQAFNFQAVGFIPLGMFDIFGKVGYYNWDADAESEGFTADEKDWDINYGVGAAINFGATQRWGIRAEYERFELSSNSDIDLISLGATLRF